jgi:branched-chain amino acid transport system permease protein
MVGGAHTVIGPIASSVLFSLLTEFLRLQFPYLFLILLGLLLILLVLYLPGGLASLIARWRLDERLGFGWLARWRKSDA